MKDTRDPTKLYERIKTVQKNNGCSITEAADIVEQMYNEQKVSSNGKPH